MSKLIANYFVHQGLKGLAPKGKGTPQAQKITLGLFWRKSIK